MVVEKQRTEGCAPQYVISDPERPRGLGGQRTKSRGDGLCHHSAV